MSTYELPLNARPQKLSISLAGVTYRLTVKWNPTSANWVLDIADINGVPILCGVPIVTGVDLLGQFGYLNFGGKLIARTDFNADIQPGYTDLGVTGHLYWVTA